MGANVEAKRRQAATILMPSVEEGLQFSFIIV